jgi:hypothetical protein
MGQFLTRDSSSVFVITDENNIDISIPKKGLETIISYDFNVNQMAVILGQVYKGKLLIIKDFTGKDTRDVTNKLVEYLRGVNIDTVKVTGDSSGNSTSSKSADESDYTIIKDVLKGAGIKFKLITPKSNPSVSYSIDVCNRYLSSNSITGEDVSIFFGTEVGNLLISLKSVMIESNGTFKKKGKEDKFTHFADAFRYLVMAVFGNNDKIGGLY